MQKKDFTAEVVKLIEVKKDFIRYTFPAFDQKGMPNSKPKFLSKEEYEAIGLRGLLAEQSPMPFYPSKKDYMDALLAYRMDKQKQNEERQKELAEIQKKERLEKPEPIIKKPEKIETTIPVKLCRHCRSPRIVQYKIRSDNFHLLGSTDMINEERFYQEDDTEDKPDLNVLFCQNCKQFGDPGNGTINSSITVIDDPDESFDSYTINTSIKLDMKNQHHIID